MTHAAERPKGAAPKRRYEATEPRRTTAQRQSSAADTPYTTASPLESQRASNAPSHERGERASSPSAESRRPAPPPLGSELAREGDPSDGHGRTGIGCPSRDLAEPQAQHHWTQSPTHIYIYI
eukprot:3890630-Pleurochrysis_carterae.AAC.1